MLEHGSSSCGWSRPGFGSQRLELGVELVRLLEEAIGLAEE